jgi:hypothetical protein
MNINPQRPLLAQKRVKFFTRSFSLELYRCASGLFVTAGYPCVRLTDQTADGYFYTMLNDRDCDVAINVDEDAFIADMDAVLDLAEYVLEQGYANAGCPDCQPGCPRSGNPLVTNPFFNIFNLELIRTKWEGSKPVRKLNYDAIKEELRGRFDCPYPLQNGNFEQNDGEPYYNFFFWLCQHFKTLYLPSYRHADGFSTVLLTPDNRKLCAHSWYSRRYRVLQVHTDRINNLIDEIYAERGLDRPVFGAADERAFKCDLAKRYVRKCITRVLNWPRKWRKWYLRWKRNRK